MAALRQAVEDLWKQHGPGLPYQVQSADELRATVYRQEQQMTTMLTAVAFLAVGVAMLGAYALVSDSLRRRRTELVLHRLHGAWHAAIVRVVMSEFIVPLIIGLAVGLSLGAWLAVEVAARYPDAVSRLVMVSPVGLYLAEAPVPDLFGRRPDELAEIMFADLEHPLAQVMLAMAARLDDPAGLSSIPFELLVPTLRSMGATARLGWDPYLHDPKLPKLLHRVAVPTLLVHGTADRFTVRAHCEAYAGAIDGARIADVDGAGHLVPLEQPTALAALVRDFLAG
jgi:pimeloyl-ACP methyl ester carboxylesterase